MIRLLKGTHEEEKYSNPLPVISALGIESIVDIETDGDSTLELMILNGRTLGQSQKYYESINPNQFTKRDFLESIKTQLYPYCKWS